MFKAVVDDGASVFFTGNAGTGKSYLLRAIVKGLTIRHAHERWSTIDVTASTGIAAANIGGGTIHAFSGVGFGDGPQVRPFCLSAPFCSNGVKSRLCCAAVGYRYAVDMHRR